MITQSQQGVQLVTGGSGYFGSVLASALNRRGYKVRIFDLVDSDQREDDIEFVGGDICDSASIESAMKNVAVCYHNVASVPLAKNSELFERVNREGTEKMLRAALGAGVGKVIHTSSSAVYGMNAINPVDEKQETVPGEAYGKSKLDAEKICEEYSKLGLDVSIIRPRTIMGQGRLGIMQILFEWVRQGRKIPVIDGGHNLYQFVHGDDLVQACVLASQKSGFAIYNIGAKNFGSMRHTLQGLITHAGTGSSLRSVPSALAKLIMKATTGLNISPLGPYHSMMYGRSIYFDTRLAEDELGYDPLFGNVEMFCESYDYYCSHRQEILSRSTASHHRSASPQGILELLSRLL